MIVAVNGPLLLPSFNFDRIGISYRKVIENMDVFLLWHIHDITDDDGTHEEEKLIGVFSSETKADEAIEQLKGREGFKDYPLSCFEKHKLEIDRLSWGEGFTTVHWSE